MSITEKFRLEVEAAPRVALEDINRRLFAAYLEGRLSEAEVETLSTLIDAKQMRPTVAKPRRIFVGSKPRSSASLRRRRAWTCSGRLPPALAAHFTPGEAAVMAALAVEVMRAGDCRWPHARLAAISGTSVSVVKRALRQARDLGLVTVEERRVAAFRNDPNVVQIVSADWLTWLQRGGGGDQSRTAMTISILEGSRRPTERAGRGYRGEMGRNSMEQPHRGADDPVGLRGRTKI